MQPLFLPITLILAWLLTPSSVRMVNIAAGQSGVLVLLSLGVGVVLAMACASHLSRTKLSSISVNGDVGEIKQAFGEFPALLLVLSGRIPFFLFISTGLLVTAGFAFNEIFLYWFPNFLFAGLLLLVVALINLGDESLALRFQSVLVSLLLVVLMLLIVLGVVKSVNRGVDLLGLGNGLNLYLIGLGFISFLGFDFHRQDQGRGAPLIALSMGFLVLAAWSCIALLHVDAEKLATSEIAHMLVARSIAGDFGRQLMGVVVILGALSGVNGLFVVIRRMFDDMKQANIIKFRFSKRWVVVIVFALVIEAMMMTGVAGEDILEVQIFASILLWMLYVVGRIVSTSYLLYKFDLKRGGSGYLFATMVFVLSLYLAIVHPQINYIFSFQLVVLAGALMLALILRSVNKFILHSNSREE